MSAAPRPAEPACLFDLHERCQSEPAISMRRNKNESRKVLCRDCKSPIPEGAIKCHVCSGYQNFKRYFQYSSVFLAQIVSLVSVLTALVATSKDFTLFPEYAISFTHTGHSGPLYLVLANNLGNKEGAIASAALVISVKKELLSKDADNWIAAVPLEIYGDTISIPSGISVQRLAVQGYTFKSKHNNGDLLLQNSSYFYKMLWDRGREMPQLIDAKTPQEREIIAQRLERGIHAIQNNFYCPADKSLTDSQRKKIGADLDKDFEFSIHLKYIDSKGKKSTAYIRPGFQDVVPWYLNYQPMIELDPRFKKTYMNCI